MAERRLELSLWTTNLYFFSLLSPWQGSSEVLFFARHSTTLLDSCDHLRILKEENLSLYNFLNFNRTLNSAYYMKGTIWRTFQIVTHLILITIMWNGYCYYHHFTGKKTRATSKWQRWYLSQTKFVCFQSPDPILSLTSIMRTSFSSLNQHRRKQLF